MRTKKSSLSPNRISRVKAQGYQNYTDQDIADLAFGNRFAYQLCVSVLFVGVLLCNTIILGTMMTIAFLAVILPNHPFDYIYNYLLANRMNKPKLPPRSRQLKFTCTIATLWIGATICFAQTNMMIAASIMGYSLVGVALLVSITDYCIPSVIYNAIFGKVKIA